MVRPIPQCHMTLVVRGQMRQCYSPNFLISQTLWNIGAGTRHVLLGDIGDFEPARSGGQPSGEQAHQKIDSSPAGPPTNETRRSARIATRQFRATESLQKALEQTVPQRDLKALAALASEVEQARAHRGGTVPGVLEIGRASCRERV